MIFKGILFSQERAEQQKGQSLTEYTVLVSLVAVAAIAVTALFGGAIRAKVAALAGAISGEDTAAVKEKDKRSMDAASKAGDVAKEVGGMKVDGDKSAKSGADLLDSVILE